MGFTRKVSESGNNQIEPSFDRRGWVTRRWRRKSRDTTTSVDSSGTREAVGALAGSEPQKEGVTIAKRPIADRVVSSGWFTAGIIGAAGLSVVGLTSGLAASAVFFFPMALTYALGLSWGVLRIMS